MSKSILRDCAGLAGAVLFAFGAGMIYRPAGVMLGGVLLVLLAIFGFGPEKKTGN